MLCLLFYIACEGLGEHNDKNNSSIRVLLTKMLVFHGSLELVYK